MTKVEAPLLCAQSDSIMNIETRKLKIACWLALVSMAVVRAWFTRYEYLADAVSYLDIGRAIAEGHLGAAVHAYWSPGYPVLVSVFLWLFRPTPYWECPLVHFVNVLIFIGTVASFQLFWSELFQLHREVAGDYGTEIPENVFWALGYAAFGIANLNTVRVGIVGPDLLVSAFCNLAGWSTILLRRAPNVGRSLLLGLVLAIGYYAKVTFFPMGIVIIVCACSWLPMSRRTVLLAGTAMITFLLVCAPFIAALSLAKGRFTFGDSARLNHAFFIDGVQHYQHWQGGPPGSGMPIHSTHKLNDYPEIYEFAAPNMGSYPPWFDPTYWYEGITPHFSWKNQAKVFISNLLEEFQIIIDSSAELACIAVILALLSNYHRWMDGLRRVWFIWVPGGVALFVFALVHVEPRFLGGWLLMLFAGAICASILQAERGTHRAIECIAVAALITVGAAIALQATRETIGIDHASGRSPRNALIAAYLLGHGLHPGDQVAVIGYGSESYWAHLARLHVVAEIPANITSHQAHPSLDFWESRPEQQQKALTVLKQTGAKAVIAGSQLSIIGAPPSVLPFPWERIDGTDAYVYFF